MASNSVLCMIVLYSTIFDGAFTQVRNDDGSWKPVYEVVQEGEESDVRELLNHGCNVNAVDESGSSALHYATNVDFIRPYYYLHSENIVNMLIANKANVNIANKFGNTALHIAAITGLEKIAQLLVQNGANVNAKNKYDETPLHNAAANGNKEMPIDVRNGITSGYDKMVNLLLENQADPNVVSKYGDSALHFAANGGYVNILKQLIVRKPNINMMNNNGNTALHLAVTGDKEKSVKLLLDNNARSDIKNTDGKTPKDLAVEKGLTNILSLLKNNSIAQRACNFYSAAPVYKIIRGINAAITEFPWMVALGYHNGDNGIDYRCAGSIISPYFILTAAHCITAVSPPVLVRLGKASLINDESERTETRYIESRTRHPGYVFKTKKNDIALIKVTRHMDITDSIAPICLQLDINDIGVDKPVTATGWGITNVTTRMPSTNLQKVDLKTIPLNECNETVSKLYKGMPNYPEFRSGVDESQYCAQDPDKIGDTCQGDSGGPLQVFSTNLNSAKLVGITSFSVGCATEWPGIYTRVAYYKDWIESNVWPNGFD